MAASTRSNHPFDRQGHRTWNTLRSAAASTTYAGSMTPISRDCTALAAAAADLLGRDFLADAAREHGG